MEAPVRLPTVKTSESEERRVENTPTYLIDPHFSSLAKFREYFFGGVENEKNNNV